MIDINIFVKEDITCDMIRQAVELDGKVYPREEQRGVYEVCLRNYKRNSDIYVMCCDNTGTYVYGYALLHRLTI